MVRIRRYFNSMLEDIFLNSTNRLCTQLRLFCIASTVIAVIMTVLNLFKAEYMLGLETGVGAVVSGGIYWYASKTKKYLPGSVSICVIFLSLLTIFLKSGAVEGFAALWFCLYPFICLFILNIKAAICFAVLGLTILAAYMWTPLRQTLPPVYTQNFLLRFPLLYLGNFAFAMALNGFYSYTYNRLLRMKRQFERLSNQDGLTKLANRTYLEEYELNLLHRPGLKISAAMLDVDFFKQYNDTYGHLAGDEALKAIAARLMESLPDGDCLAVRYGGEEFLVLLPGYGASQAAEFAQGMLLGVKELRIPHSAAADGYLSVSIGVSSGAIAGREEFQGLLKCSDQALYRAKQNGRGRVERDETAN